MKLKCVYALLGAGILLTGCWHDYVGVVPDEECEDALVETHSWNNLIKILELYPEGQIIQIDDDIWLEGVVVSSDKEGANYQQILIQNIDNAPRGILLKTDMTNAHFYYPFQQRVFLNLKGLSFQMKQGMITAGLYHILYDNPVLAKIPSVVLKEHLIRSCALSEPIEPTPIKLETLSETHNYTFQSFTGLSFASNEFGKMLGAFREDSKRLLQDCNGNELWLVLSGYEEYYDYLIPESQVQITGIIYTKNGEWNIELNSIEHLKLIEDLCPDRNGIKSVFISEIADPDNDLKARFIELYNAYENDISLQGWEMQRYTNADTTVSSRFDLSSYTIKSNSTFVIAADAQQFELVYGIIPDAEARGSSVANSNGDDNLVLVNSDGKVIDIFGRIGEDGSGTDHEFEDGRAYRKSHIKEGTDIFDFEQWEISNDSGGNGTELKIKNAPEDYNPGIRIN
ncbi:MAG: DUF5689 domain-containing protein [Flavobacteriaceae bacterium]